VCLLHVHSDSDVLTPLERYDAVARRYGWLPCALSDTTVPHSLNDLRAAYKHCGWLYPRLAYDLCCEIAWRETLQQMREVGYNG
jgi:hypothetical protein